MLTSAVIFFGADLPIVSVKTLHPIPKEKLFNVLAEIKRTAVKAPIKSGDIVIKNAADTGVDIVSTKTVQRKRSL
ncbi:MAG: DUF1667 domain-containing protein [Thermoplasmatales archaeon]|nr:DUF1667 domain-containing protein [Thermoplasmatales archaeon]